MNYKKIFQIFTNLILITSFLAACGARSTTGKIEGRIFRSDTNEPISNARVTLLSSSKQEIETMTDNKGNYSFAEVIPGKYGLSATWISNCTKVGAIEQDGWFVVVDNKKNILIATKEALEITAGDTIEKNLNLSSCP